MTDNPYTREKLKSHFQQGSYPTQSNFADLIDGMLNQVDDGIIKLPDTPLQINAVGDAAGVQPVINFYEINQINQGNPSWSLQLNPVDPSGTTHKLGFCIADGSGNPHLFIDKATGHIGIGTNTPRAQLEIIADEQSLVGSQKWHDAISLANIDHAAITLPAGGLMFGLHATNKRFYFADYTNTNYIMVIDVVTDVNKTTGVGNATGGVSIGINNIAYKPIATLDIAQYPRTETHPTAIKGLYVTGNFQPDSDGVEFRHTNGTKGIGFGYNTIYATGYDADQDLNLKARGEGVVNVLGIGNISGTNGFKPSGQMLAGSLSIGDTKTAYGGGTSMNKNIAGLLLTTSGNTEIAVNENTHRLASLMYYEGSPTNKITIGRDMGNNTDGYGSTPVTIASDLEVKGKLNGNLLVSGGILAADPDPNLPSNFTIEVKGTASNNETGDKLIRADNYLKVNNTDMGMTKSTGLNTVILNFDGSIKKDDQGSLSKNFNTCSDTNKWNDWADWVNDKAKFGDIVAVASWDAIGTPPANDTDTSAANLLRSVGAYNVFNANQLNSTTRTPYSLLFIKGRNALEIITPDYSKDAVIITNLQTLLDPPINWIKAILQTDWSLKDPGGTNAPAQYSKNREGIVSIEGFVSGDGTEKPNVCNNLIFTLSEGYRPLYGQQYIVCCGVATVPVSITPDGKVYCTYNCTSGLLLNTISFRAAP